MLIKMKKLLALSLFVAILMLCSACGNKQTTADNSQTSQPATTSQETTEKSSPDAPASGTEWPTSLVGDLPKPDCQTIKYETGKTGSPFEGSIMINVTGMKDGDKYIESLKALGYSSMTDMTVGDAREFIGAKDDRSATAQVTYNPKTLECSIIYGE